MVWFTCLALLASLGQTVRVVADTAAVDFYHFWLVGQAVQRDGIQNVYSPESREAIGELFWERAQQPGVGDAQRRAAEKFKRLETTGTPFLYAAFYPFVSGSYDADRILFNGVAELALIVAVVLLCQRLGFDLWSSLLALLFVLVAFEPAASDLRVGNVNRMQLALLVFYLWFSNDAARSQVLGGVLLGLAAMFKPNAAFVLGVLFLFWWVSGQRERFRSHLVGVALAAVAAFIVSSLFFGTFRVWLWWLEAGANLTRDFTIGVEEGNFALSRLLEGVGAGTVAPVLTVVLVVVTALVIVRAGAGLSRRELATDRPFRDLDVVIVGLGCALSLIASPLTWLHYFVLGLILVFWGLRPDPAQGQPGEPPARSHRIAAVAGAAGLAMGPILHLVVARDAYVWGAVGNAGLLLLWGVGLADVHRVATGSSAEHVDPALERAGPTSY